MAERKDVLDGEILDKDDPGPQGARDEPPPPTWIERNRGLIEQGKTLAQTAIIVSPPPARLALAALSVVADGILLREDMRTGKIDRDRARLRVGGIAIEGLALVAASRLAPAILARNRSRLKTAKDIVSRMEKGAGKRMP